jgi:hypothetical protein
MSSSGISSVSSGLGPISEAQREQVKKMREAAFSAVSELFQESPDDLKKELASGKSLGDLAAEKGFSSDDLLEAIQSAVKEANPSASDDQVAEIAQRMISAHPHRRPPRPDDQRSDQQGPPPLPPDCTVSIKA